MKNLISLDRLRPVPGLIGRLALTLVLSWVGVARAQDYPEEPVVEPPLPGPTLPSDVSRDEPAWSQQTVFGAGPVSHGGYGGLMLRASSLDGDAALFVGGRGGWLINHHLLLGAGGLGQTLNLDAPGAALEDSPDARNLEFGYGGFQVGYHILPEYMVHGLATVLVGGGGLALSDRNGDGDVGGGSDALFVVEPEVALETNVVDFMRVQFTLGYRLVWGVDMPGLSNRDVSGPAAGTAVMFGLF